jgi:hypothetical protein
MKASTPFQTAQHLVRLQLAFGPLVLLLAVEFAALCRGAETTAGLEKEFAQPPVAARPWAYWWWLNGVASKEGITRDFEEMRKQGIGGALLFDAGEAGPEAPRGPKFMSPEWRELYKHAVREADRCGIVLGVNLCSGWNAGGPWVTPEHAAKKLVVAQTVVNGPGRVNVTLPKPGAVQDYYRDITVLACPVGDSPVGGYTLRASSQYQNYGPALAEDGDEESRWVSDGGKATTRCRGYQRCWGEPSTIPRARAASCRTIVAPPPTWWRLTTMAACAN